MKTYLVGGAVRDQLLGLEVKDCDWVVVGATPATMTDLGFKPVGSDFPVFLHPKTHEEYALARTERKSGKGYKGFTFHTDPSVTLEEDLRRRDLTINAIALGDDGVYVDPYKGRDDLDLRIIRHVSEAFTEDPLRVLRVARFQARFAELGFTVAEETLTLMRTIVQSGELNHLTPERVWQEFERALSTNTPSAFLETLKSANALYLLKEFEGLSPAQLKHIDTQTLRSSDMKFALLCTLAQLGTTDIETLCQRLRIPNRYRDLALSQQRHGQTVCHFSSASPTEKLALILEEKLIKQPTRLDPLIAINSALHPDLVIEPSLILNTATIVATVQPKSLIAKGFSGAELGKALRQQQLAAIASQEA